MSPILSSTRLALCAWGRWGRGQNLGLPTLSPMFGERALKSPLYAPTDAPGDVLAVDRSVARIDVPSRAIVIRRYQRDWRLTDFMQAYRWTKWRAREELELSIWAVHVQLTCVAAPDMHNPPNLVAVSA